MATLGVATLGVAVILGVAVVILGVAEVILGVAATRGMGAVIPGVAEVILGVAAAVTRGMGVTPVTLVGVTLAAGNCLKRVENPRINTNKHEFLLAPVIQPEPFFRRF